MQKAVWLAREICFAEALNDGDEGAVGSKRRRGVEGPECGGRGGKQRGKVPPSLDTRVNVFLLNRGFPPNYRELLD